MNNRLRKSKKETSMNVTINDLAKELGVSKTTISRTLSGKGRISPETREKVLAHIKERGYRPNLIARSLAVSKTFNIAVVLPSDTEFDEIPFFQACLHSIARTAEKRDYDVIVSVTRVDDISSLERIIRNKKADGVILTRPVADDPCVKYLKAAAVPFVVIGSTSDASIVQIDSDHYAGCRDVTRQVLEGNFRSLILLAGNPDHQVTKDRHAGFEAALAAAGKRADSASVFWNMTDRARIDDVLLPLMEKKPGCLVCMDDTICGRVLGWLQRKGFSIPGDVCVVSFHDSAIMELHNPPITALHVDVPDLGSKACNAILDMIEGKEVPRRIRVGYEVIVRNSSRAS
jgi:DNA-binding LacI/PurR family transcriptional regulator